MKNSIDPYSIQVFQVEELLVNITHHELVPKHMVLTEDEKAELLQK
jgi:DNA-directed RNA polymerases I, II, and III subunit RPABC1